VAVTLGLPSTVNPEVAGSSPVEPAIFSATYITRAPVPGSLCATLREIPARSRVLTAVRRAKPQSARREGHRVGSYGIETIRNLLPTAGVTTGANSTHESGRKEARLEALARACRPRLRGSRLGMRISGRERPIGFARYVGRAGGALQ